jgi:hypothetical protein
MHKVKLPSNAFLLILFIFLAFLVGFYLSYLKPQQKIREKSELLQAYKKEIAPIVTRVNKWAKEKNWLDISSIVDPTSQKIEDKNTGKSLNVEQLGPYLQSIEYYFDPADEATKNKTHEIKYSLGEESESINVSYIVGDDINNGIWAVELNFKRKNGKWYLISISQGGGIA